MKIKLLFKWFDLWIGLFIDRKAKAIYIFPVPMFGILICYNYCVWCKSPKSKKEMVNYDCCKKCDIGYH